MSQKTTYGQEKFIGTIPARLKRLGDSQSELDEVHVDLLEMKSGEKEVTCRDKSLRGSSVVFKGVVGSEERNTSKGEGLVENKTGDERKGQHI